MLGCDLHALFYYAHNNYTGKLLEAIVNIEAQGL